MKPTDIELQAMRDRQAKPRNGHAALTNAEALFFLQQASVQSDLLTGSPEWDYFLSNIQTWIDATKHSAAMFRALIEDRDTTEDAAKKARMELILCNDRIAVLEAVVKFPSQVKQVGAQAKLELEAIGGDLLKSGHA